MKVVVAVPCYGQWHAGFGLDLVMLSTEVVTNPPPGVTGYHVEYEAGTILPRSRFSLVEHAREHGADWILWLDADMRFPKDALHRLLDRQKDIVCANYTTRRAPYRHIAARDGLLVFTDDEATGIERVDGCGFGVMLTSMRVFDALKKPYFAFAWDEGQQRFAGEDYLFCRDAKAAGFDTWIDHDLTKDVRHIGEVELRYEIGHLG